MKLEDVKLPDLPTEETPEAWTRYRDGCRAVRKQIEFRIAEIRINAGYRVSLAEDRLILKLKRVIEAINARENEAYVRRGELLAARDRQIGRRYRFLCRAIAEEFGEESLKAFIQRAEELSTIDAIARDALEDEFA